MGLCFAFERAGRVIVTGTGFRLLYGILYLELEGLSAKALHGMAQDL